MNVQKVVKTERTQRGGYESKNGFMYTQLVTLDNGDVGEVSSKQEDRWKVGDECLVTNKTSNQFGTRLSLSKPGQAGTSFTGSSPSTQNEINVSWAINCAIQLGRNTPETIKTTALNMLQLRDDLKMTWAGQMSALAQLSNASQTQTENESPF